MRTMILSIDDTRRLVERVGLDALMDEMIARLTTALRLFDPDSMVVPARDGFQYCEPELGLLEWMPAMATGRLATVKVVGYHPANPAFRNLPSILSTVSAYDTASGHLIGMMDGTFLTALRTGAASAVASRLMASPAARTLGLVGCGAQAVSQFHALSRSFDLREVLVYDVDGRVSGSFASRSARIHRGRMAVRVAALAQVVSSADILCTSTSVGVGEGPVFEDVGLRPWIHVNAIGSDFPGKWELPLSLLRRSVVCPDFAEQAVREGECQRLAPEEIGPGLVEIVQHRELGVQLREQPTVFDSTGWALEDQVAMEMLLEHAMRLGVGAWLQIESNSSDPRNPYHFLEAEEEEGAARARQAMIASLAAME